MATQSYTNSAGLRQDLLNQIKLVQETMTPLVSKLKTAVAKARNHEWISDRVSADTTPDGAVEGATFSATDADAFTSSVNYCQIIREDFAISGTMEASDYAGITSFVAYQKQKNLKKIGVRLEGSIINGTGNSGASGTARIMKGFAAWSTAASHYSTANTVALTALGSSTGENMVLSVLEAMYKLGVESNFLYCSPAAKRQIDKWSTAVTKYVDMNQSKGVMPTRIAVYESSFGVLELMYTPSAVDTALYVGDMDALRIAYLRKPFSEVQGKNGDAYPVMVLLEGTLEVLDPQSIGKVILS